MSCPGLHCPGCSDGQSIAVGGALVIGLLLADQAFLWVADRIWWIGATVAACFALSIAVSMVLERWNDRKAAEWGAARGILSRADMILPGPVIRHTVTGSVLHEPLADLPGEIGTHVPISAPQVIFNFYGVTEADQAHVISQALNGGN